MTARLPIFPLGSVLVPHAVLGLHIFEPRYRVLMFDCTRGEPEFGVVLIERGAEVGGGDQRFEVGTVARIAEAGELPDGRWVLRVIGTRRIKVAEWQRDDPYPVAMVDDLVETPWSRQAGEALALAEPPVRRALGLLDELMDDRDDLARLYLASDPEVAAWQLVARAPLGSLDRQRLLEIDDHETRLQRLAALAGEQATMLAERRNWG